jgi:AcrR family transcriptional regulator
VNALSDVNQAKPAYRQVQAAETRRRIALAARRAFGAGGYADTSVQSIAREAGVAVRTVYAAFGTKKAILAAVCEEWLIESDARSIGEQAIAATDPRRSLALLAHANRAQWEMGRDVVGIMATAAAADAEVASMFAGWRENRMGFVRRVIGGLAADLQPGLGVADASAMTRAFSVPEIFEELAAEGWSADRYEEWLAALLAETLLRPSPVNRGQPA